VTEWHIWRNGWVERQAGDGLAIPPFTSKFPAVWPAGGFLKTSRSAGFVRFEANEQDHIAGKRRATKADVVLDRARAEALRDWLSAFLAE
jgi:hypothetical protein